MTITSNKITANKGVTDINWNVVIEQVKRSERLTNVVMKYQALKRKPLTEAQARRNIIVYLKNMAGYKMNYFKIIPDDDDVYTNATPLALKILIVDYKIHTERNRPYFKIIRADGNHMLFMSLSTMMKNFDREYLESLWKIVRERFEKTEAKNYTDDYLLNTLNIMFEKPNIKANIFLLVEKMYPLTHFTLEQMVNDVKLEVDYESEISLELLRLVRRQLNEGTAPDAPTPQVLQTPMTSTTTVDTVLTQTNSPSHAEDTPNTLQDVDKLEQKQHVQQQDTQAPLLPKTVADNVLNAMLDGNMFVYPFAPPSTSVDESSSS
nr:hypothetical protein [Tanacetum cinerariifolium]